jgi:RNA polymerase II subunit A small phosphatase-like protein
MWTLVIFTASTKAYADRIIDSLDRNKLISKRLYRDSCTQHNTYQFLSKDLTKIENFDLASTVIVDDKPENFDLQKDNGIRIRAWFNDDPLDRELQKVEMVLTMLEKS